MPTPILGSSGQYGPAAPESGCSARPGTPSLSCLPFTKVGYLRVRIAMLRAMIPTTSWAMLRTNVVSAISDGSFHPSPMGSIVRKLPLTCDPWSIRGSAGERRRSHAFGMGRGIDTSPHQVGNKFRNKTLPNTMNNPSTLRKEMLDKPTT
jgi:hypothetical protein